MSFFDDFLLFNYGKIKLGSGKKYIIAIINTNPKYHIHPIIRVSKGVNISNIPNYADLSILSNPIVKTINNSNKKK